LIILLFQSSNFNDSFTFYHPITSSVRERIIAKKREWRLRATCHFLILIGRDKNNRRKESKVRRRLEMLAERTDHVNNQGQKNYKTMSQKYFTQSLLKSSITNLKQHTDTTKHKTTLHSQNHKHTDSIDSDFFLKRLWNRLTKIWNMNLYIKLEKLGETDDLKSKRENCKRENYERRLPVERSDIYIRFEIEAEGPGGKDICNQ
jgi:hypothetical protein